jgi:hypothetical protein
MNIDDDPLFQRAEAVLAEAARLRQALEQSQEKVRRSAQRLSRIEAELDPLLSHPPEELRRTRELTDQDPA